MRKGGASLRLAVVVLLLSLFVVLDLRVALYHLSTEGKRSGLTEVVVALVVLILVYVGMTSRPSGGSGTRRIMHGASVGLLSCLALLFLFLSVYHFTHQGIRSGSVELSLALLLLLEARLIL